MASELFTLGMLILLQIVLGFDNLLYISILSKQAPENKQKRVQTIGIAFAIFLRIGLLFLIVNLIPLLQGTLLSFNTAS
ncbi:MAG: putative tellurium resistance membrane protein TerC [Sphingobacteriales bacterium]|jgi:predicted tellurium resistance membrane protein TerC